MSKMNTSKIIEIPIVRMEAPTVPSILIKGTATAPPMTPPPTSFVPS